MNTRLLLAAALGAGLTAVGFVALGDASDDGSASTSTASGGSASADKAGRSTRTTRTGAAEDAECDELRTRYGETQKELAALHVQRAFLKGQLSRHIGEIADWPKDLPNAYEPGAFEEALTAAMAGTEDLEVLGVDCDEYPCVAFLRDHDLDREPRPDQRGSAAVADTTDQMKADAYGENARLLNFGRNISRNGTTYRLSAITFLPPGAPDPDLKKRVDFRVDGAIEDFTTELDD